MAVIPVETMETILEGAEEVVEEEEEEEEVGVVDFTMTVDIMVAVEVVINGEAVITVAGIAGGTKEDEEIIRTQISRIKIGSKLL